MGQETGTVKIPSHNLLLLTLLLLAICVLPASADVPANYSGYQIAPYVNSTNQVAATATWGNAVGQINVSSAFYPPIGAVTETVWLPYEWAVIFFIFGLVALFLSTTTPELRIIAGIISVYCFTVLTTSGPFVVYHGVETINSGTSALNVIGVVQPWQEIWLMGPWYAWGNFMILLISLGNLAYSAWEVTHAMITRGTSQRRSFMNDHPDRKM